MVTLRRRTLSDLLFHDFGNEPIIAKGEFGFSGYPLTEGEFIHRLRKVANSEIGLAQKVNEPDIWSGIVARHRDFVDLLNQNESAAESYLNRMFSSPLTHGLEQGDEQYKELAGSVNARQLMLCQIMDKLARLAEACACVPVENPEQGERGKLVHSNPDLLLDQIEEKLETKISPPAFKGDLFCLKTGHGLFTSRDFLAIYEANRIAELCPDRRTAICEIGGGTGYLPYYCQQLGFRNYTIIDLPTVNLVQAYFLHKNLPETELILSDDSNPFERGEALRVLSSRFFKISPKHIFDIVVNVDSLPEIADEFAVDYLRNMSDCTKLFLSINQESMAPRNDQGNVQARVTDQVSVAGGWRRISRHPFWMRKGYVEEVYVPYDSAKISLLSKEEQSVPLLQDYERRLRLLSKENSNLRNLIVETRGTMTKITASKSWRLIAPFRQAASALDDAFNSLRGSQAT